MALAAMQSYTSWRYTFPDESPYEATLKKFGHFFYATNEAHLTMMFISLDCLCDDNTKRINFQKLLALIKPKLATADYEPLQKRIEKLHKLAKGIGIIRNNSIAYIAERQTRVKLGNKYALKQAALEWPKRVTIRPLLWPGRPHSVNLFNAPPHPGPLPRFMAEREKRSPSL
jgi:hypothetical protein